MSTLTPESASAAKSIDVLAAPQSELTAAASPVRVGMGAWPGILLNETHKGLLLSWSYKFNLLTMMLTMGFIFIGIVFFMGRGDLDRAAIPSALLGYLMWFYALTAISNMSWDLREEAQTGTLEQRYLSPAPTGLIQLGRSFSNLITTTIIVGLFTLVLVLLLGVELPLRLAAIPVFILTMMGLYGFGFLIGGATLIFKQVESLANLVQNMLLFLNGAFRPVDRLPTWLAVIAYTLPTTQGIIVMRKVVLEGESLLAVWADGSLVWLLLHSVAYFVVGWVVFDFCERKARRDGLLGQY